MVMVLNSFISYIRSRDNWIERIPEYGMTIARTALQAILRISALQILQILNLLPW
jgi:hypothetical protein